MTEARFNTLREHRTTAGEATARKYQRTRTHAFDAACFIVALLMTLAVTRSDAETSPGAFDNANRLYEQGKFAEAAAAFEKLVQAGVVSEPLYFNWGNALFKSGHIGRAIGVYEQAERLSPRDPDVRANLQFARNKVQGPTLLPDKISRWFGKLTLNEWTGLAAAGVWVWLALLTLGQWRPALKPALGNYTLWVGVFAAFLCVCFFSAFYFERLCRRAVVIVPELVGHQAPLDESPNAFTLHDGAELLVLDQKDEWLQVRVDARRIGWVRRDSTLPAPPG